MLYYLHVCVRARQVRQLHLMIPLVVIFVSCELGAFLGGGKYASPWLRKMEYPGVDTIFGKGTCKMVRGEMVLMKGVQCGTMYKLLGRTYTNGCNSSVVHEQRNK